MTLKLGVDQLFFIRTGVNVRSHPLADPEKWNMAIPLPYLKMP